MTLEKIVITSFGDPLPLGNFSLLALLSNWIFQLTIHQRCMGIFRNNTLVTQQYPKMMGLLRHSQGLD